jgi:Na+-translocating ferredoxin:NAD+ oxidoreductase RnfC subunit
MIVFDKQGLKITFKLERSLDNADLLIINMVAQNSGLSQISEFLFQAAVPKVWNNIDYIYHIINIIN